MWWLSLVKTVNKRAPMYTGQQLVVQAKSLETARSKILLEAKKLPSDLYITNQLHGPYTTEQRACRAATPYFFGKRKIARRVRKVWFTSIAEP